MDGAFHALQSEIDAAAKQACAAEPYELRQLRKGKLPNRAGSYGQYFSTWVIAHGMLRDYAMYTLYPLLRLGRDPACDIKQLKSLFLAFDPPYSHYLGYSGLESLARFATRLKDLLDVAETKEQILIVIESLTRYANQLSSWSHHYFPWDLGVHLKYGPTAGFSADNATAIDDCVDPTSRAAQSYAVPKVRLDWEPLGLGVTAILAEQKNPELCEEFLNIIPFSALQEHALVSGMSIYVWAPIVSFAPIRTLERICDAPVGRLRFSQATGSKLVIQYGETTETLFAPVLGQVIEKDLMVLKEVGHSVWRNTFTTKDMLWLHVSTVDT